MVARSRESSDRRLVTLRATPGARRRAEEFTTQATLALQALLAQQDDAHLDAVRATLDRFAAVLPRHR
jgi:DNA-binding MarR family transcriptional regulator